MSMRPKNVSFNWLLLMLLLSFRRVHQAFDASIFHIHRDSFGPIGWHIQNSKCTHAHIIHICINVYIKSQIVRRKTIAQLTLVWTLHNNNSLLAWPTHPYTIYQTLHSTHIWNKRYQFNEKITFDSSSRIESFVFYWNSKTSAANRKHRKCSQNDRLTNRSMIHEAKYIRWIFDVNLR